MRIGLLWVLALAALPALSQTTPSPVLDNAASDPRVLGWMQGTPVPPDKVIRYTDGSYWTFPKLRWSFSNIQQIAPTLPVRRSGPTQAIGYALRSDIDAIRFTPIGSSKPMRWRESLDANYTDAIVVMHRGKIIYEYVSGGYDMTKVHIAASVTKSFIGLTATMLIHEGKLDPDATVETYLPEMAGSGWAGATVQQVLDMTTGLAYRENFVTPGPDALAYFGANALVFPADYAGPRNNFNALRAMTQAGPHGARFDYRSPHTDVLGWITARVSGRSVTAQLEDRYWSKLGMESDANMLADSTGAPFSAGGFSLHVRDLARFAEMLRNDGRAGTAQVVPKAVIAAIRSGGDRAKFGTDAYPTLPRWSYRNQFWISHDDHGMYMGRGIHGQMFYVNPRAELVIARFASHPVARNAGIDPTSLPAWRALADHLIANPR